MPAAEVDVTVGLVRALLDEQHPDLAGLDLGLVANGWDNAIFRLGSDLAVRLPRRAAAAELVRNEQRWLPELAPRLPVAVPVPVRVGVPALDYPWPWSVVPWFDAVRLCDRPHPAASALADQLGEFLRALHRPAPDGAPANPVRGIPLAARERWFRRHLADAGLSGDDATIERIWRGAVAATPSSGHPMWLHGDLHPANVLVADGSLAAVIDFGDLTAGDRATDLAVAWMAFDASDRDRLRVAAGGVDDAMWTRARGWALTLAVACIANSADNADIAAIGERTLAAVISDEV